jgi:hypothetical protein
MRGIIVLLLLANVAFFAWSHWVARPERPVGSPPADAPRLVLASEAPAAPPLPTLRLSEGVECVSLGPFLDLTEAARASTGLREAGLEPRQRAKDGAVWNGYWVSLAGLADPAAAEEVVERLRASGVGDAYVMPADGAGPTVSLGLFTEQPRALRRMDEVRALGFEPRIEERQRSGTVYWIDVDVNSPEQLPDPASFEDQGGRIFRLEVKPCDLEGQSSEPVSPAGVSGGVPG